MNDQPEFPDGPPGWPVADPEVFEALRSAWADGSWGKYHGPHVPALTRRLQEFHDVAHAVLCSSGTIAVELALRGLKVSADDEVLLAGYDFPGNFRAIEAIGARPVLVDIDPATWCLDARRIADALSERVTAIVVSHLHGGLATMSAIRQLADAHGVALLEDACQCPGARVEGRPAGTWGDAGVLSFGGSKLLTAGRGGAVLTPHADVLQRIKVFAERGNDTFPLSELQAAVLVPQLNRLDERNKQRAAAVSRLTEAIRTIGELRPVASELADSVAAYYKHAWLLDVSVSRDIFLAAIRREGVAIDAGFRGFTRRGPRRCRKSGALQHSLQAAECTVILHHPVLLESAADIDRVAGAIHRAIAASRESSS